MARAGARESLEQPPPEPRTPASGRASSGGTAKGKAVAGAPSKASKTAKAGAKAADRKDVKAVSKSKIKPAEDPAPEPAAPKGASSRAKKASPAKAAKPSTAAIEAAASAGGFPAKTLEKLARLLEGERETYLRQAQDLAAEAEALASEREPGDTQFDEESGEGDTLNVERERDLALSASARQAVDEIDRALSRMAAGTYGICERCGKKISVARLEALPYAALCIDCKSREERRR